LTVLFGPPLGFVGALQEAYNANILLTTDRVQKNDLGRIFDVPGSKWVLGVFYVSTGNLGLRRLGSFTNALVFYHIQNELPQDKIG